MVKLPCKDCQNRHLACHDTCKDYIAAKEEHVKEKNYLKEKTVPPISLNMLSYLTKLGKWGGKEKRT